MTDWTGHPWGYRADHRPVGHGQAICAGCDERCSEQIGCMCCSEQAYEWLLAEAIRERDEARRIAEAFSRLSRRPGPGGDNRNYGLPWEVP